jgi:hypothetical protein
LWPEEAQRAFPVPKPRIPRIKGSHFDHFNYRFKSSAAPFADFFSDYDAMGVVTVRNGEVVEDASEDYLKLCASGQTPVRAGEEHRRSPRPGWRKNNAAEESR